VVIYAQRAVITNDRRRKTKTIILVKMCLLHPYHMEHLAFGRRQIVRTGNTKKSGALVPLQKASLRKTPTARANDKISCHTAAASDER